MINKQDKEPSYIIVNGDDIYGEETFKKIVCLVGISPQYVLTEDRGVVKQIETDGVGIRKPATWDWCNLCDHCWRNRSIHRICDGIRCCCICYNHF